MSSTPTFVFQDEKAYAFVDGQIVASADNADELESKLAEGGLIDAEPPGDIHTSDGLIDDEVSAPPKDHTGLIDPDTPKKKKKTTTIITPNGLKGYVLSRHASLWEDELTVRLENGQIAHYSIVAGEELPEAEEEEAEESETTKLKKRLETPSTGDKESMVERAKELESIKEAARSLIVKGASNAVELDELRVAADYELSEVNDTLEYYNNEEAEAIGPPMPTLENVAEQETLGRGDGLWLDQTVEEMIDEASNNDYAQLLDEGPEVFVSDLEDPALADASVTRAMASSFIREKTATAINEEVKDKFEQVFLSRVEEVRKQALANRKETTKKQAAKEEEEIGLVQDEQIFL